MFSPKANNNNFVSEGYELAKKKVGILNINIINEVIGLIFFSVRNFFILKYLKTSWCKCLLSGFEISEWVLNLLNNENKFSNAGYHNNKTK